MATFGELLQELRKDHRLSQKQLADVIAVTTGTVSNYENNQHLPDIEKLIMLADYFGVTTDYLLGRSISRLPPDIFEEQLVGSTGQAACCARIHSRYFTGGSPSGLRV